MITLIIKSEDTELETYDVNELEILIGRDVNNDVCLDDPDISREHCLIKKTDEFMVITDLKSQNGTYLNGKRVLQARLADNDIIGIGKYRLVYKDSTASEIYENVPDEYRMIFYLEKKEEEEKKSWKMTVGEGDPQDAFVPNREDLLIGRGNDCDVILQGKGVSWHHVLIVEQGGTLTVINVSEKKDLFINGLEASKRTALSTGFFLKVGENNLAVFPEK